MYQTLVYTPDISPSLSLTMSMPSIITLDDRYPRLKWAGGYFLGPRGPDPQEYGQSDTILEEPGSTMTFTFNGT